MRIHPYMNLKQLAILIADGMATDEDAKIVRDELLRRGYEGLDTRFVDEQTWFECAYQVPTA